MKKLILFTVIIINCIQLSVAQKIYLNYKIKTKDSLFEFQDKAISDKNIETKAQNIFRKHPALVCVFSGCLRRGGGKHEHGI